MKMTVVEVLRGGKACYLVDTSMFAENKTTDSPLEAKNYANDPEGLRRDLADLVVPGDEYYAKSGLRIEALPQVVEFEFSMQEVSRRVGRELAGTKRPAGPKP